MKVLLDECVPRNLKRYLSIHDCQTVPEMGLAGKKNGELLSLAEAGRFEVFLSLDQGLEFEQNLRGRKIGVVLVQAKSSRLADLINHVPEVLTALGEVQPGHLIRIPR
jgi:hypothetical protein